MKALLALFISWILTSAFGIWLVFHYGSGNGCLPHPGWIGLALSVSGLLVAAVVMLGAMLCDFIVEWKK